MNHQKKVKLVLEDGSSYEGYSFGASRSTSGEVVFNTGMVGYPESLTDLSYRGQILVLTYPLIGNYGVPAFSTPGVKGVSTPGVEEVLPKYFESDRIQIQGLVISDYSQNYSHWNAVKSLGEWLKEQDIPGIYGIDTRALTKRLRERGTMLGKISDFRFKISQEEHPRGVDFFHLGGEIEDPNKRNLVAEVSIEKPIIYYPSVIKSDSGQARMTLKKKVVLVDTGGKYNIIRSLVNRGVTVVRVPWDYDFFHPAGVPFGATPGVEPNGIILTNGPGDPKMCRETITNVKKAMAKNIPIFGICLGNQILALASGANTYKLKYGHRSQNQPCIEVGTKRCYITSQNHGFAVDGKTLPKGWQEWFVNANDDTNEGIRHQSKPFMSVQFHPEATPGPGDTGFLFDKFIELIR